MDGEIQPADSIAPDVSVPVPPQGTDFTNQDKMTVLEYFQIHRLLSDKNLLAGQDDDTKLKTLQETTNKITAFVTLLATKKDAVIEYSKTIPMEQIGTLGFRKQVPSLAAIEQMYQALEAAPSVGGRKKQRGGFSDFTFSKIYNTQGLITDDNDPIEKGMNYINTADQIPQPFSSVSSGATYSSGLEPSFLQDVLPVLNMAGGMKQKLKSKQVRK